MPTPSGFSEKERNLQAILAEISNLQNPTLNPERIQKIAQFIISTVNGDNPIAHLVLNANLSDSKVGIVAYILTDMRLIKFDIDAKELKSNIFPLNTLIGIERELIEDGREQFRIAFQNGSFGLKYPQANTNITHFFQQVEGNKSH